MAITTSAKKANRVALRRRVFNVRRADTVRKLMKEIKQLVSEKKGKEAVALVSKAYKAIDKAAKMHTFHKNVASRKKSQVAKMVAVTK